MNKKIIQIIIIVVALGASVFVLFNGFFKTASQPIKDASTGDSGHVDILPEGTTLDFSNAINTKRFNYDLVSYPQLDPKTEVGVTKDKLIVPQNAPKLP